MVLPFICGKTHIVLDYCFVLLVYTSCLSLTGNVITMPTPFSPAFNRRLRLVPCEAELTADSGAVLLREIMDALGLPQLLHFHLVDPRDPTLITHSIDELARTLLLLYAQGWQDQDDADFLRDDPALRLASSGERGQAPIRDGALPSQPTLSRFIDSVSHPEQRLGLRHVLLEVAARRIVAVNGGRKLARLTLDIDSMPAEVHGRQAGSAYNGHYHCQMFHPLIATSAELGDILDMRLRPGNVHTADDATAFVLDLVKRTGQLAAESVVVRMDAGFPGEELMSTLETGGIPYVARIKSNANLDKLANPHLGRRPGHPPATPRLWFHEFTYAAGTWSKKRRVVLIVKERLGELINEHFWLITSIPTEEMDGQTLLEFYRRRGTAEGHFGEYKDVLAPLLSAAARSRKPIAAAKPRKPGASETDDPAFGRNEAIMLLNALAYNLMHAGRVLVETETGQGWSLRRFRQTLLRVAGRLTLHAGQMVLHIHRQAFDLWEKLWPRLDTLRPA
jgi:hypothetical protein